jgi:hypothetical protein
VSKPPGGRFFAAGNTAPGLGVAPGFLAADMKRYLLILLLALLLAPAATPALAQGCSLCTAQTNGGDPQLTRYRGQSLNTGILYLAAVPYLAGSLLGLMWYRNRRRLRQQLAPKR